MWTHPLVRRIACAGLLLATLQAQAQSASALPPDVEAALQRAGVPPDAVSAVVQDVGPPAPRTWLQWQASTPVNPASLMKLVTTGAALDLLGPAWSWSTPVWLQGSLTHGVLHGNLVLKGSGDPKLVQERVWQLLRRVQQLGVREIRGDIVLDRSSFALPPHNAADFDNEPSRPSNAGPDALLLNYKSVLLTFTPDPARGVAVVSSEPPLSGVRVDTSVPLSKGGCDDWRGSLRADLADPQRLRFAGPYPAACAERQWPVAYADPASYNARMLGGLWREMGGKLSGRVRDGDAPTTAPSFEVSSPPLAEVVRDINKFSNNVMAQQLFLTLPLVQRGQSGAPEPARELIRSWLTDRFGDTARGAVIDNGSGLSRDGRLSAQLLAQLLQFSYAGPTMPELMASLPVSGLDGTMRRARNNGASGRAHLKTGSLRDVAGLAGYVLSAGGRRYVLVMIINHPNANAARPALEALVQWVATDGPAATVAGLGPVRSSTVLTPLSPPTPPAPVTPLGPARATTH